MAKIRRCGFTLVELLVVIGVIAFLVGVLLPALTKARQQAQLIQCASNLRQWGVGIQIYADESQGTLPLRVPDGTATEYFGPSPSNPIPRYPAGLDDMSLFFNAIPSRGGSKSYYQLLLDDKNGVNSLPAAGSNNIFTCPAVQSAVAGPGDTLDSTGSYYMLYGTDSTGALCSAKTPTLFKSVISYCYSQSLMNPAVQANASTAAPALVTGAKMSQLRPTSSVVVLVEKIGTPGEYLDPSIQQWSKNNGFLGSSINSTVGYNAKISALKANWKNFAARHNAGGNLLFADGHVAYFKWTDVQLFVKPNPVPSAKPTPAYGDQYNANRPDVIWCPWGPTN
jgi:prepilin-type processing-associated H-X9-DG protein/prepilin-type N-terminal cleavage/methylation domain-containing protein